MNTSMHGKRIQSIYWQDSASETGRQLVSDSEYEVHLSATHHGDHDEFWIVVTRYGVEICRHNPRYVETIVWQEP